MNPDVRLISFNSTNHLEINLINIDRRSESRNHRAWVKLMTVECKQSQHSSCLWSCLKRFPWINLSRLRLKRHSEGKKLMKWKHRKTKKTEMEKWDKMFYHLNVQCNRVKFYLFLLMTQQHSTRVKNHLKWLRNNLASCVLCAAFFFFNKLVNQFQSKKRFALRSIFIHLDCCGFALVHVNWAWAPEVIIKSFALCLMFQGEVWIRHFREEKHFFELSRFHGISTCCTKVSKIEQEKQTRFNIIRKFKIA